MADTEVRSEKFYCSKVEKEVYVSKTYLLHWSSSTQQIDKEVFNEFDCDSTEDCGVQNTEQKFDWKKCVHPDGRES